MAKISGKKDMTVVAMVLSVVIVLALGVYAVYGVVGEKISNNKLRKELERVQTGEATVEEFADVSGKTVDEVLASYGVSADDGVNGKTNMMEMADKMTLDKYCEFMGVTYNEEDFVAYKTENKLGDDITAETKDSDVKKGYAQYAYQKALEAQQAANENTADTSAENSAE